MHHEGCNQSQYLKRSISTAPTNFLLLKALFHSSVNLKRTPFVVLYTFQYGEVNSNRSVEEEILGFSRSHTWESKILAVSFTNIGGILSGPFVLLSLRIF